MSPRLPGHLCLGSHRRGRPRREARRREGAPVHARRALREGQPLPGARREPRAAARPAAAQRSEGLGRVRGGRLGRGARPRRGAPAVGRRRARRRGRPALQLHGHPGRGSGRLDGRALLQPPRRDRARSRHLRTGRAGRNHGDDRQWRRHAARGPSREPPDPALGHEHGRHEPAPLALRARGAQGRRAARRHRSAAHAHRAGR